MVAKYEDLIKSIKEKKYAPIYLLMGDEPYYIDEISNLLMGKILSEEEKSFNQTVLYGKDTDVSTVINTAKRFPMMSKYQVVVLKEAQNLKKIDDLKFYAQKPLSSTVLIIHYKYGKLDKRTALYKEIEKTGIVYESKKLYDYQLPQWINTYLNKNNYSIDPKATALLIEFLGTDIDKIANELNKLFILLPQKTQITADVIEKNIGVSKEYNTFELQKALGQKNALKVYRIVDYLGKNQNKININSTLAILLLYFSKLILIHELRKESKSEKIKKLRINPYFLNEYQQAAANYSPLKLRKIVSLLRNCDIQVKGINNNSSSARELLIDLCYNIMNDVSYSQ